ncbi:hypothetical protein BLOT_014130 [Blomia tropicalis]|nr:hypothetical protein BLOT_014130 [Blomia tropicalis]
MKLFYIFNTLFIYLYLSPTSISCRFRPSNETHAELRESGETQIFNSTPAGTTIGRNESECGHIGVIIIAGTLGWIIEAPAATAYAVLPVGVETINPSPCTVVIRLPSIYRSTFDR